MSAVANKNLIIPQGATWSQTIGWKAGSPALPVNLEGFSAGMQVRTGYNTPAVAVELSTDNSRISLGAETGTIILALSASETASIEAGRYVYDLKLVNSAGIVTRLLSGLVIITPESTR